MAFFLSQLLRQKIIFFSIKPIFFRFFSSPLSSKNIFYFYFNFQFFQKEISLPRIKEVYIIPSGSKAYPHSNISIRAYNNLLEDLALDNNQPRPICAGGTGAANASQARINLGMNDASNLTTGKIIATLLPFYPIQQGGGRTTR